MLNTAVYLNYTENKNYINIESSKEVNKTSLCGFKAQKRLMFFLNYASDLVYLIV